MTQSSSLGMHCPLSSVDPFDKAPDNFLEDTVALLKELLSLIVTIMYVTFSHILSNPIYSIVPPFSPKL